MKRPPLILVTASVQAQGAEFADRSTSLSDRYSHALTSAGGLPWVCPAVSSEPLVREAVRRCEGVLLTGGDDLQPELYCGGGALEAAVKETVTGVSPERDLFELLVVREAIARGRPILAICRGLQLLNVALGGSLWTDLGRQRPSSLQHNRPDRKTAVVHTVALTPGSLLSKIVGQKSLGVNSTHHQAVDRVAEGLQATAVSPDGVVEGLEWSPATQNRMPFLVAVQFHPERLLDVGRPFADLFHSFVQACRCNTQSLP
jgi:putative glutamine amidotransferase